MSDPNRSLPLGVETDERWNYRVARRPEHRERVVTVRDGSGQVMVREKLPDPVPAAVQTALIHNLHGVPLGPPDEFDGAQRARFWALVAERQANRGRRG